MGFVLCKAQWSDQQLQSVKDHECGVWRDEETSTREAGLWRTSVMSCCAVIFHEKH